LSPHNDYLSGEPKLARVLAGEAEARTVTIGESASKSLLCGPRNLGKSVNSNRIPNKTRPKQTELANPNGSESAKFPGAAEDPAHCFSIIISRSLGGKFAFQNSLTSLEKFDSSSSYRRPAASPINLKPSYFKCH
jgi:hypothetical protein